MKINNVKVYGVNESIRASGLPKVTLMGDETYSAKRAVSLGNTKIGSGHDNYLNGIVVQFDIIAPQYFWQQIQRYHFMDFVSSMSKMHMITELNISKSCNSHVLPIFITELEKLISMYKDGKVAFEEVLSNVPMGLEMGARMTTNYRQLKTIYEQRNSHVLGEWKIFCKFIRELDLAKELGVCGGFNAQHM